MDEKHLDLDPGAPAVAGAKTPEDHIAAMLRGYRADRLATYDQVMGMPLAEAEKYAAEDTEKQRAKMVKRLDAARRERG